MQHWVGFWHHWVSVCIAEEEKKKIKRVHANC